jgi:hypothetical protein
MFLSYLAYAGVLGTLLSPSPAVPQALSYDVVVHNRAIGQLSVRKAPTAAGVQYHVEADVDIQFFGAKRMVTHFTSTYCGNVLTESSFHDQLNGRTKHQAQVRWDGRHYQVRVNGMASTVAERPATYSSASLYDREPEGIGQLFSERHGRFCRLKPVAAHTYELTLPDGKKNYYRYLNGRCQEVEVQHPLFTIFFRLRHD